MLSVKELQAKIALAEAAKASQALKAQQAEDAAKAALFERLSKSSGLSDDEIMDKANAVISRAAENGLMSVQVFRFPNHLCTDNGRAINQQEPGWENTLTGHAKEIYEFWKRRLQPLGYRIAYSITDYPGGMPGDVRITLRWD
jgi:hypothetical protein